MNEKQKRHYRARMAVAQLFRSALDQGDERARFLERLDVKTMPVIVPAPVSYTYLTLPTSDLV